MPYSIVMKHSVSLGTDPPSNPQPSNFFCPPGTEKRQTKSRDNSNVLHMLNNNAYSDIRTAYKYVLIPSYVTKMSQN